jgi:hypothetical protein
MATMTLYSGAASMYGAKAHIAALEKGLPIGVVMMPFTEDHRYEPKHPEVLRINPKRQVPVLIRGRSLTHENPVDVTAFHGCEFKIKDREILAHVRFGPGPGQRNNSNLRQIAEQDLRRGAFVARRQGRNDGVSEELRVRSQRPKALVDDALPPAKLS